MQMLWDLQSVMSVSRMANGDGEWFNQFYGKQCHVWCLYSSFQISSALWLFAKWSSFTLASRACSNVEYLIRAVCYLWGSRQSLSRRQYAPNKLCGLNNDVCLITRLYSTLVKKNDHRNNDRLYNIRIQFKLQLKMFQSQKQSGDS